LHRCTALLCRDAAPANPYSKDAACPPEAVRRTRFDQVYEQQGTRSSSFTRICDYLTFIGNDTADALAPGGVRNPTLVNTYELTGALVSTMDETTERYTDVRMLNADTANPQAQVGIDFQGGLTHALAGLAALPPSFHVDGCPTPAAMKAQFQVSRLPLTAAAAAAPV
jgi:hypothetical protein